MKRTLLLLFLFLGVATLRAVPPVEAGMPGVVQRGFESLVKNGTLAALDVWLAGSAGETDDRFRDEAAERMNHCLNSMGRSIGFEAVRTVTLSPSTRRVYAVAKFEKGVGWMSFDCYRPAQEWIICRLAFDTNPNLMLPPGLLSGDGLR